MSHKKYRQESDCLNCGATVDGKYCQECGQENLDLRENFFHMAGHFIADYLHFDSKFFRSIIPLFTRPGFLTQQYWAGKRVHYIHPLRLFFFVTILFVIVASVFYQKKARDIKQALVHPNKIFLQYDSAWLAATHDTVKVNLPAPWGTITAKQLKDWKVEQDKELRNLEAGIDIFFIYLKYATFLLLPVYALIFKMLYLRRRSLYVDQLVYTMHLQSFAYCLFSITFLLPIILPVPLNAVFIGSLVVILIYVVLSLRFLYNQPWWKTLIKSIIATFALMFSTIGTLILFAVAKYMTAN